MIRCNLCRRGATFLAADLIKVVDPKHPTHQAPLPCSKCGSWDYIDVRSSTPTATDYGKMEVRRLVGFREVPLWRNKKLGE